MGAKDCAPGGLKCWNTENLSHSETSLSGVHGAWVTVHLSNATECLPSRVNHETNSGMGVAVRVAVVRMTMEMRTIVRC